MNLLQFLLLLFAYVRINTSSPVTSAQFYHQYYVDSNGRQWILKQDPGIGSIFNPSDWLPIEINVPDTVIGAWHGLQYAWTTASDYFSMANQDTTHHHHHHHRLHIIFSN